MVRTRAFAIGVVAILMITGASALFWGDDGNGDDQTLMVGISTDVNTWSYTDFPNGDGRFVWSQVYETLVRLDTDLNIVPGLATSWESPDNGTTWTFHLQEGVLFHDESEFTADAVIFSYSTDSYVKAWGLLQPVVDIVAEDDHTVTFTLARQMALPMYLTHVAWPVMSPNCEDSEGNFLMPIGTGPYMFQSQTDGQEIVLVKNDDYWGEEPTLKSVVFKVIPDASTRMMALEAGDIDMALKVPESDVTRMEGLNDIDIHRTVSTFTDFLQFNCEKAPFTDTLVRKAVANAIDTELIVDSILDGIGEPAYGEPLSSCMLYVNPDLEGYEQDLDEANALLDEAGWVDSDDDGVRDKNGTELQVTLLVPRDAWAPRHDPMAQAIQGMLADVGIDVELLFLETSAVTQLENEGDFDILFRTGYFVWGPYPRHFLMHASYGFFSHYSNSTYDQLVGMADGTSNETLQCDCYYGLQEMIIEEVPAFYVTHEEKIIATRSYVSGYKITSEDPWLNLSGITLDGK